MTPHDFLAGEIAGLNLPPQLEVGIGYCECGCGQRTSIQKYNSCHGPIKGTPKRFVHGHNNPLKVPPPVFTDKGYETECLIWQGCSSLTGYGQTARNGKMFYAHRTRYQEKFGEVPKDIHVHHLCGVRLCVNVDHMRALSRSEHARLHQIDRPKAGGHPTAKLSDQDVVTIRKAYSDGGITQLELAEIYGVRDSTISRVVRGKRHVSTYKK